MTTLKTFIAAFVLLAALSRINAPSMFHFDDPVPQCDPCIPPAK